MGRRVGDAVKVLLLGATGHLGREVARQALAAGHALSVAVRQPARLQAPASPHAWAAVHTVDLERASAAELAALMSGQDAVINAAGYITDGERFEQLFARVVEAAVRTAAPQPVLWMLAGAALLELGETGRLGVDLPVVGTRYGAHRRNWQRLQATSLDWRLLCPGPMVEHPAFGLEHMQVLVDRLPLGWPGWASHLPAPALLPAFVARVPTITVPYADAAALLLAHLAPGGSMSRRRVGLALPPGQRLRKRAG